MFVDKGKTFAALLTDLSKASDCLPQDLNAYGVQFLSRKVNWELLVQWKAKN